MFDQLDSYIEVTGGFGVVAAGVGLILVVALVLTRQYRFTTYSVLAAMLFSLFADPFHTVFDLLRWVLVVTLIPLGIGALREARASIWFLMAYWLIGTVFLVRSPHPLWSAATSLLIFATISGFGGSLLRILQTPADVSRLFTYIARLGAFFAIVNGVALVVGFNPGQRMAGAAIRSGQLSLAGGALLPFLFWRALHARALPQRIMWIACGAVLASEIVISTQRTGMLLGAVPSLFLLFSLKREVLIRTLLSIFGAASLLVVLVLSTGPDHVDYIVARLQGTADSGQLFTGRVQIWEKALSMCMEDPFLGHGLGSDSIDAMINIGISFHNAFLAIWYNTGLVGLAFFVVALVYGAIQSFAALRHIRDPELYTALRLVTGLIIGLIGAGFFERSSAGGANLLIAMMVLCLVCAQRGREWALASQSATHLPIHTDVSPHPLNY